MQIFSTLHSLSQATITVGIRRGDVARSVAEGGSPVACMPVLGAALDFRFPLPVKTTSRFKSHRAHSSRFYHNARPF